MSMKVVIDTNILINSSYDESSYAFRIVKEVIEGRIEAYATHKTMRENRQMIRNLIKDREYRELLENYFRNLKITKPGANLEVVSDPEDNKLFESAQAACADYLVSEDREVLDVGEYRGTKVVTPQDFWAKYKAESGDDSAWKEWTKIVLGN